MAVTAFISAKTEPCFLSSCFSFLEHDIERLSLLLFLSLSFKNLQGVHRNLVGANSLWSLFAAVQSELALCIVDGKSSLQGYSAKPMQGSAPWGAALE